MLLSLLILTINGRDKLPRILPSLQGVADELIIGVDENTQDDTAAIARQYTDKVYPVRHAGFCGAGSEDAPNAVEDMLPHCSGEWVLRIDHDEILSPLWSNPAFVTSLLRDRYATHYWIPRRWVLPPGDRFISNRRWYPDYQLRLYRNIPSLIRFNRLAHEPPVIAGEGRKLTRAWINHLDFVWHDRLVREAKVAFYKDFSPFTGEQFYLYEDCRYESKALDYFPASRGEAVRSMPAKAFHATIRLIDAPPYLYAGEQDSFLIEITNGSDRVLRPPSNLIQPGNVSVSYHWYLAGDPPVLYEWDGERQTLPGRLEPGQSMEDFLSVKTPLQPGEYLLQPDLVEEGVAWYSWHCPFPNFPIQVVSAG